MNPQSTLSKTSTLIIAPLMNLRSTALETRVSKAVDRGFIGGVMVSVLVLKAVDCGFIGGIMVSVLVSKAVDRGFMGGVMVSVLFSKALLLSRQEC
jgi:hypothetical protein